MTEIVKADGYRKNGKLIGLCVGCKHAELHVHDYSCAQPCYTREVGHVTCRCEPVVVNGFTE